MYTPGGGYATKHRMRLLLSQLDTVQTILGVANATDALAKIQTYAPIFIPDDDASPIIVPEFQYPRILIHSPDPVRILTSIEGIIDDVESRDLLVCAGFYVPSDVANVDDPSDEEAWVDEKFWNIVSEALDLQGTGEPVSGETYITLHNPTYMGADRMSDDERDEEMDSETDLPRWMGMLRFEVR